MNWTTEVPKEYGYYWARVESEHAQAEVVFLHSCGIYMMAHPSTCPFEKVVLWGDKLEIPE